MTPAELAEIRERCEKATPGPWARVPLCSVGVTHQWLTQEDDDFCSHARTDIPALIAEVERLRTVIEEINNALWSDDNKDAITDTLWFDDECTLKDYIDMFLATDGAT